MKRRQVLSGIALVGLTSIVNGGEKKMQFQSAALARNGLEISDFETRIFREWAVAAAHPQSTRALLREVHADFLVTRSLTNRASGRTRQRAGYRVMAWQGVLLTTLHTRLGEIQQARQAAAIAREFGYQCGDRAAVASAYDRESIAEIWYGTPELGSRAAVRGIKVIENEAETPHGKLILAGLHSQAMVHYSRVLDHAGLSEEYERQVRDWQQRLPEIRKPNAFELTPSQMYNSLAVAHAFRQQPSASEFFAAGFRATAYEANERMRFRKLLRLNQAWCEAPHNPGRALEIAADVMQSFARDKAPVDPIYSHRAARTIHALPKSVPPNRTAELRTLIGHPRL
jgi:hypothetical protein